jgi:ketosteroid isomerase-like protein
VSPVDRIAAFYQAFQRRDGDAMAAHYHPGIRFSDPVFPELRGDRAGAMWRMLCHRGRDLTIGYSAVSYADGVGRCRWEARYAFGAAGRPVHNVIHATFRFAPDGRILEHVDAFPFWLWSAQALGPVGALLGWSPLLRRRVRAEAARGLERWLARPEGPT